MLCRKIFRFGNIDQQNLIKKKRKFYIISKQNSIKNYFTILVKHYSTHQ